MTEQIKLNKIEKNTTTVQYFFECSAGLKCFFHFDCPFIIEYNLDNMKQPASVADVPDSVLIIPFLGNVLPIVWLTDSELYVPEIDKDFYDNLSKVKKGYAQMYPNLKFKGKVIADKIVNNNQENRKVGNPVCFFSAGVDAWQTLCEHYNEKPLLLTMFGADFYLDNIKGNRKCLEYMKNVSQQFHSDLVSFKSSLRKFINETKLNEQFAKDLGFHWWHRIQHGLGVISHAAPVAYLNNSRIVYFASSYSFKDKVRHQCATDPLIDNYIAFAGAKVVHDGYEFTRQDKIYNICNFSKKHSQPMFIHVCWGQYDDIHNCSKCEKCQRTWMGILAEGFNPNDFGFKYEGEKSAREVKVLLSTKKQVLTQEMWEQIFDRFKMNAGLLNIHPELKWVESFDFKKQSYFTQNTAQEKNSFKKFIKLYRNKLIYYRYKFLSQITIGQKKKHYMKKSMKSKVEGV